MKWLPHEFLTEDGVLVAPLTYQTGGNSLDSQVVHAFGIKAKQKGFDNLVVKRHERL